MWTTCSEDHVKGQGMWTACSVEYNYCVDFEGMSAACSEDQVNGEGMWMTCAEDVWTMRKCERRVKKIMWKVRDCERRVPQMCEQWGNVNGVFRSSCKWTACAKDVWTVTSTGCSDHVKDEGMWTACAKDVWTMISTGCSDHVKDEGMWTACAEDVWTVNEIASSCTYPHVWLDQSLGVAVYSVVVYSVVVYLSLIHISEPTRRS